MRAIGCLVVSTIRREHVVAIVGRAHARFRLKQGIDLIARLANHAKRTLEVRLLSFT
jgi:hypothetical protein